jgi:hypothetical protein
MVRFLEISKITEDSVELRTAPWIAALWIFVTVTMGSLLVFFALNPVNASFDIESLVRALAIGSVLLLLPPFLVYESWTFDSAKGIAVRKRIFGKKIIPLSHLSSVVIDAVPNTGEEANDEGGLHVFLNFKDNKLPFLVFFQSGWDGDYDDCFKTAEKISLALNIPKIDRFRGTRKEKTRIG